MTKIFLSAPSDQPWQVAQESWFQQPGLVEWSNFDLNLAQAIAQQEDIQILALGYEPQLRRKLNQSGFLQVPLTSIFDQIQGCSDHDSRLLDFKDLTWDFPARLVFTPFQVLVYEDALLRAKVDLGQSGQIIKVSHLEAGIILKEEVYDDRGFRSSVVYFKDGHPHYQEFLTPVGDWVLSLDAGSGLIQVSPTYQDRFKNSSYKYLDSLIKEYLDLNLTPYQTADQLLIQDHPSYDRLGFNFPLAKCSKVLICQDRLPGLLLMESVDVLETNQIHLAQEMKTIWPHLSPKIHLRASLDSRLPLGKSQEEEKNTIYLKSPLDSPYLKQVLRWVRSQENLHILLDCYQSNMEEVTAIEDPLVEKLLFQKEKDLLQAMDRCRVLLDLRPNADVYLSMLALVKGIPIISLTPSVYLDHGLNGWLVEEGRGNQVQEALEIYINDFQAWNRSLIHSLEKRQGIQ